MQFMHLLLWLRMDEDEIDNWYEEEKQKCMDEYVINIEKSKNHDEAEKGFDDRLGKVMEKYNKLMNDCLKKKNKKKWTK